MELTSEFFSRRPFAVEAGPKLAGLDDEGRWPPLPGGSPDPSARSQKRFPVLHLDDLVIGDDPVWLIDGLLPASGFGVVYGAPKSGKSFILADALFHVAMDREWAGREVLPGAIVYVTGEGVEGFKRRLIAMRRHYEVEGRGVPFVMVPVAPDLGRADGDAAVLIEAIREYLVQIGNPTVRAIAIDTLARTMRGADENAAKDMSAFVDNAEALGRAFGCLCIAVHHAGKDTARGARGSNSLYGAVDVMWRVEKAEGFSSVVIEEMKDAAAGANWRFRLAGVSLREATASAQAVTAAVVEILSEPGDEAEVEMGAQRGQPDRWPTSLRIFRGAITNALASGGSRRRPFGAEGAEVMTVAEPDVRAEFASAYPADGETPRQKADAKRKAFKRALQAAIGKGLVVSREISGVDHLWLA